MHNSLYLGSGLVAIYMNLQEDFNFWYMYMSDLHGNTRFYLKK